MKLALHWQILIGLLLGAVVGLTLNALVGTRGTPEGPVRVDLDASRDVPEARRASLLVYDSPNRTELTLLEGERVAERYVIDGRLTRAEVAGLREDGVAVFASMDEFKRQAPRLHQLFQERGASWARYVGESANALGGLFLRMLKMLSVPLIIFSLSCGVLGLGQAERLGSMFGRTIGYYICTSLLAIFTGLAMSNLIQPGVGDAPPVDESATRSVVDLTNEQDKGLGQVLFEQLQNLIPENPFNAVSRGNFLSIIAFSIAFAVFTLIVGGRPKQVFTELAESGFRVMMSLTMAVIALAPFGVFFLILYATATQGVGVFIALSHYMLTVTLALGFHAVVTLPLILWFVAKRNPLKFAKAMSPALLTAFSSASSNATLPLTLENVEDRAGVSNKVSSFVLPLGATVNMDGTALYEVVAVLFIANVVGVPLTLVQQLIIAFTALLASIGAAGIPHAGLVMMAIILQAVGLPIEQQGLIIAVDRVLDMARTAVNVWSDSCGCAVVARLEGFESEPFIGDVPVEGAVAHPTPPPPVDPPAPSDS